MPLPQLIICSSLRCKADGSYMSRAEVVDFAADHAGAGSVFSSSAGADSTWGTGRGASNVLPLAALLGAQVGNCP